ncbi:MAG: peptidylprolyl isomerase [Candidatus Eisenbacteria bacterium]
MARVKQGDRIRINYKGSLDDGTMFDANESGKPFEFEVGAGRVIPGFDRGVVGMSAGDVKRVEVAPEDAYGPYRPDLCVEVEKSRLGEGIELTVGQPVQIRRSGDMSVIGHLKAIRESDILVDANHPLAGKKLTFDIELLEIL